MQLSGRKFILKSAVFLDRDGVINEPRIEKGLPFAPVHLSEVKIIEAAAKSIDLLRKRGFEIIVVTNQPDVARGKTSLTEVDRINNYLGEKTGIDHFYTCYHDDLDYCECRKPKIGLLRQAAIDLNIDLNSSFMIGDRWRDIEAGQAVGCVCYFIDYSYQEKQPQIPYFSVNSLYEAAQHIVRKDT